MQAPVSPRRTSAPPQTCLHVGPTCTGSPTRRIGSIERKADGHAWHSAEDTSEIDLWQADVVQANSQSAASSINRLRVCSVIIDKRLRFWLNNLWLRKLGLNDLWLSVMWLHKTGLHVLGLILVILVMMYNVLIVQVVIAVLLVMNMDLFEEEGLLRFLVRRPNP